MILKRIIAGPLVQEVLYDNIIIRADDTLEEKRDKMALRKSVRSICSNRQYAIASMICCNFTSESLWCTLTFDSHYRPASREETARRFSYFRSKLKKRGYEIKYLKCMEHLTSGGVYHIHAIIDGAPAEEILECWIYNGDQHCQVEPLEIYRVVPYNKASGRSDGGLASYITKERQEKVGQRQVQCSQRKNKLIYPEITRRRVPDNYNFSIPEHAKLLEQVRPVFNQYGQVWYCRYLMPYVVGVDTGESDG